MAGGAALVAAVVAVALAPARSEPVRAENGLIAFAGIAQAFSELPCAGRVFTIRPDGTDRKQLARGGCPEWSPNGRQIAFSQQGIRVVAVDGTGARRLTAGRFDYFPRWSPDGRRIAFVRVRAGTERLEVRVVPATGGRTTKLGDGYVGSFGQNVDPSYAWSPDGRRLVLSTCRMGFASANARFPSQVCELSIVRADGRAPTRITRHASFRKPVEDEAPAWSPDAAG